MHSLGSVLAPTTVVRKNMSVLPLVSLYTITSKHIHTQRPVLASRVCPINTAAYSTRKTKQKDTQTYRILVKTLLGASVRAPSCCCFAEYFLGGTIGSVLHIFYNRQAEKYALFHVSGTAAERERERARTMGTVPDEIIFPGAAFPADSYNHHHQVSIPKNQRHSNARPKKAAPELWIFSVRPPVTRNPPPTSCDRNLTH